MALAKGEMNRLKRIITVQSTRFYLPVELVTDTRIAKQMERLDKQLAPIRKTFNDRIE